MFFATVHGSHNLRGYPIGMTWAAGTDSAILLLVAALIQLPIRTAKTR